MKIGAVVATGAGGTDVLKFTSVDLAWPRGPLDVLVELRAAALNPADRYLAEGAYPARPAMPHILGRDGVGTIVAVGAMPSRSSSSHRS